MLPTVVDNPSAAAVATIGEAASFSCHNTDIYGNGDFSNINFPSNPNHTTTQAFSSATASPSGGGGAAAPVPQWSTSAGVVLKARGGARPAVSLPATTTVPSGADRGSSSSGAGRHVQIRR
ncbi:hypothetical protein E2562_017714 [Oryza meyeriana var. granulata]|uniref:Uncharacterized protein n=1 Tax=Oryza meyeriana var. granulata TaxID=110450 RepID=A0A6G1BYA7_9ORYZ|nr:hypothetical protein E2562_017711 [Oryza meyeriana var. granulata]KAF0892751.1 hypothetical protein E2562_017714 [Oryza meyeriana var. granulata]